jgi:hypothetical protein
MMRVVKQLKSVTYLLGLLVMTRVGVEVVNWSGIASEAQG